MIDYCTKLFHLKWLLLIALFVKKIVVYELYEYLIQQKWLNFILKILTYIIKIYFCSLFYRLTSWHNCWPSMEFTRPVISPYESPDMIS